jgi:hypothetical protein
MVGRFAGNKELRITKHMNRKAGSWGAAAALARERPLHPALIPYFDALPVDVCALPPLVFYGPPGVGKYTQALAVIAAFSPSGLHYEKKLSLPAGPGGREPMTLPISDVHFEVDMALPGCGGRSAWAEVHSCIVDAVLARPRKAAIVLCKNFHDAPADLVRVFFSYMQERPDRIALRYVLLTEHLSRVPESVVARCRVIPVPRPDRAAYTRALSCAPSAPPRNMLSVGAPSREPSVEKMAAGSAVAALRGVKSLDVLGAREAIYAGLVRNMDIGEWVWQLVHQFAGKRDTRPGFACGALECVHEFYQTYSGNYRPIYHLEKLALSLATLAHGFGDSEADLGGVGASLCG